MYRFLIDEDSPKGLAVLLQHHGHDAIHVVTAGLSGQEDPQLAIWIKEQGRIIVTRDLGFGNLLTYPLGSLPGVILIRAPEDYTAPDIIAIVKGFILAVEEHDLQLQGALAVIGPDQYRIRTP